MREKSIIYSAEAVIELSQKSNVKIVTYVKPKRDQKLKRNKKHSRTCNSENFHCLNKKLALEGTMTELRQPYLKKNR